MLIRLSFVFILFTPLVAWSDPLSLALANRYKNAINFDVSQYLVSEKLDGVRGYWDGDDLYTRNGNIIITPEGFTAGWPKLKLDGELWLGRNRFEELSGIVRRKQPDPESWQSIRFMIFDSHPRNCCQDDTFEHRLEIINQVLEGSGAKNIALIHQYSIDKHEDLEVLLADIVLNGGEGLMLHRKLAPYSAGRSNDILKLKPQWDAEAVVLGYVPGKGKYYGQVGSLLVKGVGGSRSDNKTFRVGSGLKDTDRRVPPVIGSIITYRFSGYTKTGLPRFPRFLRVRHLE